MAFVRVHSLTKRTEFLVHVHSFTKRTNTNELPAEQFTNCSMKVRFACIPMSNPSCTVAPATQPAQWPIKSHLNAS
ncbi:hypothetical protein Hanom_Chr12g01089201 [Helianthus anomalus]